MYDKIFNHLCLLREFLIAESTLERQPYGEDTSYELKVVVEEFSHLEGVSRQTINDFSKTSGKPNNLRYKISKVRLVLDTLKQQLTNYETKLICCEMPRPLSNNIWKNLVPRET